MCGPFTLPYIEPRTDWSRVTEPSAYVMMSCGWLLLRRAFVFLQWVLEMIINDNVFPAFLAAEYCFRASTHLFAGLLVA